MTNDQKTWNDHLLYLWSIIHNGVIEEDVYITKEVWVKWRTLWIFCDHGTAEAKEEFKNNDQPCFIWIMMLGTYQKGLLSAAG